MAKVTFLAAGQADGRQLQMTVPLTAQGRLDETPRLPGDAPLHVTWTADDGGAHEGELVRVELGWALRENPGDDAPLRRFEARVLRPGETATLREPDGAPTEYRVVAVEPD